MTQAKCFNCGKIAEEVGKPMEDLIEDEFPIFCSNECSWEFPNKGTSDFDKRLEKLKEKGE